MNDAVTFLTEARKLYTHLGLSVDKTDWMLARVLFATGESTTALPLLRRLRDTFLAHRMSDEAGLVALDIVDALIAAGETDNARALTEQVVHEFRQADLSMSAIRAVAYLRDLIPYMREPKREVQHVRSYLEQLRSEPALLFLPLDEKE